MLDLRTPIRFFMGTNTAAGFFGFLDDYYDESAGWRAFLLKGGPGSGKDILLGRVYEFMSAHDQQIQAIVCPSDPNKLDGLVFPEIKACVLDANAPNVIEPKCWGAVEQIVNLSACMNAADLYRRAPEIMESISECGRLEARCRKFIGAAASLLNDSCRIALEYTDFTKIQRNAARIAAREFGTHSDCPGRETRRFLSAVTPEGVIVYHETLQSMCPRIYSVEDDHGASSRLLLDELRKRALDAGHDVISCYCPIFPNDKPEHILIPSIGIGFTTSSIWHKADFPVFRRIHAARFTDTDRLRQRRQLLSFNKRAARELINEAVSISAEIRSSRGIVENHYIDAMDYDGANLLTDWVITELEEIASQNTD